MEASITRASTHRFPSTPQMLPPVPRASRINDQRPTQPPTTTHVDKDAVTGNISTTFPPSLPPSSSSSSSSLSQSSSPLSQSSSARSVHDSPFACEPISHPLPSKSLKKRQHTARPQKQAFTAAPEQDKPPRNQHHQPRPSPASNTNQRTTNKENKYSLYDD